MVRSLGILPLFLLKYKQNMTSLESIKAADNDTGLPPFVRTLLVFHSLFLPLATFLITDKITLQTPLVVNNAPCNFSSLIR